VIAVAREMAGNGMARDLAHAILLALLVLGLLKCVRCLLARNRSRRARGGYLPRRRPARPLGDRFWSIALGVPERPAFPSRPRASASCAPRSHVRVVRDGEVDA